MWFRQIFGGSTPPKYFTDGVPSNIWGVYTPKIFDGWGLCQIFGGSTPPKYLTDGVPSNVWGSTRFFGIFLEFFGMSFKLVLAGKSSEGVLNQKISGGHGILHTRLTCKRPQTKPKNETGFGPTLGPHQSEREITKDIQKDILYLTSLRVSPMQTSVILLACSIWCIIDLVH